MIKSPLCLLLASVLSCQAPNSGPLGIGQADGGPIGQGGLAEDFLKALETSEDIVGGEAVIEDLGQVGADFIILAHHAGRSASSAAKLEERLVGLWSNGEVSFPESVQLSNGGPFENYEKGGLFLYDTWTGGRPVLDPSAARLISRAMIGFVIAREPRAQRLWLREDQIGVLVGVETGITPPVGYPEGRPWAPSVPYDLSFRAIEIDWVEGRISSVRQRLPSAFDPQSEAHRVGSFDSLTGAMHRFRQFDCFAGIRNVGPFGSRTREYWEGWFSTNLPRDWFFSGYTIELSEMVWGSSPAGVMEFHATVTCTETGESLLKVQCSWIEGQFDELAFLLAR